MRIIRFLSLLSLIAAGLVLPSRADATAATAKPSLQMQVEAPYVVDLIDRDDIIDALFWRVRDGIKATHRGVEIKEVEGDEPAKGEPVLKLTLLHWRQTRLGDIECRFSAEYCSADGRKSLGFFEGITSSIVRTRGFTGEDFGKAAEEAGRRLGAALREKKVI